MGFSIFLCAHTSVIKNPGCTMRWVEVELLLILADLAWWKCQSLTSSYFDKTLEKIITQHTFSSTLILRCIKVPVPIQFMFWVIFIVNWIVVTVQKSMCSILEDHFELQKNASDKDEKLILSSFLIWTMDFFPNKGKAISLVDVFTPWRTALMH